MQRQEGKEVTCERCNGRGYHHGFGERGRDPDWCLECGGAGKWVEPCTPDGDDEHKAPPKMLNGRDVADPDVRRCLVCMLRCQPGDSVCRGCGSYVSQLWPPPGSPRATHSRDRCRKPGRPKGCNAGDIPCWVSMRMRVVKGGAQ